MIKNFFNNNYKFIIFIIILGLLFYLKLPYYVMAPGGTINITDRVELDGYNIKKGSINMLYVSEYDLTPALFLYSKVMGYDISNNETKKTSNETMDEALTRYKLMRDNSLDLALLVAYQKAGKDITINSKKNIVLATIKDNNFKVGDIILEADDTAVNNITDIKEIINNKKVGDVISFKVLRNDKEIIIDSTIYKEKNQKVVGVVIMTDYDFDLNPKLNLKFKKRESGSSGGLMLTLTIYNAITDEDLIKGRKIAGTGTISEDGKVGEIDGVKYKIMGAKDMDIVFVPSANYKEAIETKKKYHYDMDIVKVDTFAEVLEYLR